MTADATSVMVKVILPGIALLCRRFPPRPWNATAATEEAIIKANALRQTPTKNNKRDKRNGGEEKDREKYMEERAREVSHGRKGLWRKRIRRKRKRQR